MAARGEDEIVLWFEHDLYDQLQLLQLLDWLAVHGIDSWRGGVHLRSSDAIWRWDAATGRIIVCA
jgi:hypothetical protein